MKLSKPKSESESVSSYHFDRQLYELIDSSLQLRAAVIAATAILCQLLFGLSSYISSPILFLALAYCLHKGWSADYFFRKKQGQRVELTDQSIRVFNTVTGYDVTRSLNDIDRCRYFDLLGYPLVIVDLTNNEHFWLFCFSNSKQLHLKLKQH